ncbi:MAG: hypothetical protein ACW990_00020 [Promethearchaeota archaeon]|jgi:hypothetical protein
MTKFIEEINIVFDKKTVGVGFKPIKQLEGNQLDRLVELAILMKNIIENE